jgi:hypothetical protein
MSRILESPTLHRLILIVVLFACLAPTLSWIEFSGGMENFNVATAVEVQRDGHWLIPTLSGEPRVKKPPLAHWLTAAGIDAGGSLGWSARWPSLLAACLTVVAVYELGRALEDWHLGLTAACVAGSSILFLKFAWQASYDLHLALWVIAANVFLAHALFKERRWIGCAGAGLALGLALMSKGPVALLQSVAPVVVFVPLFMRQNSAKGSVRRWIGPIAIGLLLMAAVALPWVVYVSIATGHGWRIWDLWLGEVVLRDEASNDQARIKWHSYIVFFPMMLPWLPWFFSGLVEIIRTKPRAAVAPLWLAILWLVLPIVVMTFFPERRDRYLLPMVGGAAVIAAFGVLRHAPRWGQKWNGTQILLMTVHVGTLVVMTIGMIAWGTLGARMPHPLLTVTGTPWYTPAVATAAIAAALVITLLSLLAYRRSLAGLVAGSSLLMLLWFVTFQLGYKDSPNGRSEGRLLARQIATAAPNTRIVNAGYQRRPMLPLELLIYLNCTVPEAQASDMNPAGPPTVLLYPPDESHPDWRPDPPQGFHRIAEQKINNGVYRAYAN